MENRGGAEDDGNEEKARGGVAECTYDLAVADMNENDFAQEFSSDLPRMAASSAPSDSPPFASSQSPSPASKVNHDDNRDVSHGSVSDMKKLEHAPLSEPPYASLPSASTPTNGDIDREVIHGSVIGTKKMEHAPPSEIMPSPGLRILERPPVVSASNQHVTPGAFLMAPSGDTSTSWSFRSALNSYDTTRESTNEESKEEDNASNMAAGSGLYTVEAQRVPDGNEEETMMVAEAEFVRTKWYQRRWISLGSILFACALLVVVVVVLVVRPPTTAPATAAPTTREPTSLTPELIACNFLSFQTRPSVSRRSCLMEERLVPQFQVRSDY